MISLIITILILLIADWMIGSLNILLVAVLIGSILYRFNKYFNNRILWYIVAIIISTLGVVFYQSSYTFYITRGYIGYAFMLVILSVGILNPKWGLTKVLRKHRGFLSILGFILITPHALLHILNLYEGINLFGIAAYALMLPLTVISFELVKKEIKTVDWIKVQKAAYLVYGLLFIHVLWVASYPDKLVYIVLLTLYVDHKWIRGLGK